MEAGEKREDKTLITKARKDEDTKHEDLAFVSCFSAFACPVEDPESLDTARDREVLERVLEGSLSKGVFVFALYPKTFSATFL